MKVMFGSCPDCLVTVLSGMIKRVFLSSVLSHNGTYKFYLQVGDIPTVTLCCQGSRQGRTRSRLLTGSDSHQGEI